MPQHFQVDSLAEVSSVLGQKFLHLAIGMFDGVHLGHRAVIDAAVQSARRAGGISGVLTFTPHPSAIFSPSKATKMIVNVATKERLLAEAGVDVVITQNFTPDFAKIEAEDFVPHLKRCLPKLCAIYVGENWRFGRGRRGDIAMLIAEAKKHRLNVFSIERINHNGDPISSTRIRECLEAGQIEEANALLGYTYFAEGLVTPGKALGRELGFPTLNVPWTPELQPKFGVYVMLVSGPKAPGRFQGIANYGLRPTVEQSNDPRIEVHLLQPCPFAGGDVVKLEWLKFIRPEMKFGSVQELTAQIAQDRAEAEKYFRE
ncbi:MAG TPA: riboflavin biosynthesis protein RibF [Opitutaceae bacterium]